MEQGHSDMPLSIIMIASIRTRGHTVQNEMNHWDPSSEEGPVIKEKKKIHANMCLTLVYTLLSE